MKYCISILVICILSLTGCSDPKSRAESTIKDGCMSMVGYNDRTNNLCSCIAKNIVTDLSEAEIEVLNKSEKDLTRYDQKVLAEMFNKMNSMNLEQCGPAY